MTYEEYKKELSKFNNRLYTLTRRLGSATINKNVDEIVDIQLEIEECQKQRKALVKEHQPPRRRKKILPEAEIVKLYNLGFSMVDIGAFYGKKTISINNTIAQTKLEKLSKVQRSKNSVKIIDHIMKNNLEF